MTLIRHFVYFERIGMLRGFVKHSRKHNFLEFEKESHILEITKLQSLTKIDHMAVITLKHDNIQFSESH